MRPACLMIAFCALSAANMSCAATPDVSQKREAAVLLNADKSDIRESIRIFIRQDAGRFVIADPDSLANSPDMVIHRRASDYESQSRTLPPANLDYRLLTNGTHCWLVRHESGHNSPIAAEQLLPETAQCAVYRKNKG